MVHRVDDQIFENDENEEDDLNIYPAQKIRLSDVKMEGDKPFDGKPIKSKRSGGGGALEQSIESYDENPSLSFLDYQNMKKKISAYQPV